MADWYKKPGATWLIRLVGLAAIGVSVLAGLAVYDRVCRSPPHEATPVEMGLAFVAFMAASAGTAMAALGSQLLDRVEVASPWEQFYPSFFRR